MLAFASSARARGGCEWAVAPMDFLAAARGALLPPLLVGEARTALLEATDQECRRPVRRFDVDGGCGRTTSETFGQDNQDIARVDVVPAPRK